MPFDLSKLRDAFLSALTDHHRLLNATLSGMEAPLLIQRLEGSEGIDEGMNLSVDVLAQYQVGANKLLGKWAYIELETQDGKRGFSGMIVSARQMGSHGGLTRYKWVLGSALDVLRHRKTWRVFLNQTALQICESIIQEHKGKNPAFAQGIFIESHLLKELPERPFVMQAGESDTDFMRRILAREGLHWVMNASQKDKHTWHIFDEVKALDDLYGQKPIISFHSGSLVETKDVLTTWEHSGEVHSQAVNAVRWNHEDACMDDAYFSMDEAGQAMPPVSASLEQYTYLGEGPYPDQEAQHQLDSLVQPAIHATGHVRHLSIGQAFLLKRNPFLNPGDEKGHRVIKWQFRAQNNVPKAISEAIEGIIHPEEAPFEAQFTCLGAPSKLPLRQMEAPSLGMVSAKAVGVKGQTVYTDALGRIRVRFLFTRPEEHPQGGASDSDADSAWVRFSQPWASEGFGSLFLPRAGDEVLVSFFQNDPDQPIVVGGLYNERTWPASFTKSSILPGDAAISGFRSRMLPGAEGGQGYATGNELLLDDTTNELRARLASDHADSQLNLGAIVAPRRQGQAQPRGDGFELKTQDSGALRAHKGLLLTTESSSSNAPQLEIAPLAAKLESAQSLTQTLKEACENHQALPIDEKPLKQDIEELQANREKKGAKIPEFSKPHLTLDSAADLLSAAQNQHHVATENLALSSSKDTQLSTGGRIIMAAREAFSLFAAKSGIKLLAGKGNVDIQAHEGQIGIIADQEVRLTSCQKSVSLVGKEEIVLVAGGARVTLKGGNLEFACPGTFTVKSAKNDFKKGEKVEVELPRLPKEGEFYDQGFQVVDSETGEPLANVLYEMTDTKGNTIRGRTDATGYTQVLAGSSPETVEIKVIM